MLDLIVVTAFAREAWFVKRLQSLGLRFVAIDVTDFLVQKKQPFTVPFGIQLSQDPDEILKCGHIYNQQIQGWSAFTNAGVIETNGFLNSYQGRLRGDLAKEIFEHQFSTSDRPRNFKPIFAELPLGSTYSVYEAVSHAENISVLRDESLAIHLREGGQFVSVRGNTYKAPYLVSLLDPYMCRELEASGVSCSEFAHTRNIDPIYVWQPFSVKTKEVQHLVSIPKQMALVSSINKPWIDSEFMIVSREAVPTEFVVWSKIIFDLRKNKKYIQDVRDRVTQTFQEAFRVQNTVVEDSFISAGVGVSPFPVYDYQQVQLYKKWYDRGLFHAGFEVYESMNLDEQVRVQKNILKHLVEENQRDRQIHP
jgi:hypothetical protein